MTNRTNKVIKQLTFDEQKQWHNENNKSIFQDHLLSKGATTYRYPSTANTGIEEKLFFLGNENQINHFNANPADIAKNIMVSRYGPQWEQVGSDIHGELANDRSGYSVSISADGSVIAIGASLNDGSHLNSGHVRIYKYREYTNEDEDENSGLSKFHYTSREVNAIQNKPLIITNTNPQIGNYYWTQLGRDINGEAEFDFSGKAVSLSADGMVVAIGVNENDGNDGNELDSGHVRIFNYRQFTSDDDGEFHYENTTVDSNQTKPLIITGNIPPEILNYYWIQVGHDIDGFSRQDGSGKSVSLSADGSVVAIGSNLNDGNGFNSGHVRVYEYVNNSWIQKGADISGEAEFDRSGFSVSLSADGSVLAIGALSNGIESGHVRVYEYRQYNNLNDNNKFHHTSTSSQTKPLIITEDFDTEPENGQFYWTQLGLDIDGEAEGDISGRSVSLNANGSVVAIGASLNDGNGLDSGHVRVYRYNPGKILAQLEDPTADDYGPKGWDRIGGDIDGEIEDDQSGFSVSLSNDGSVVAIGGTLNDGNGLNSGHVRVYRYNPNKNEAVTDENSENFGPIGWDRISGDINGEAAGDESGYSVSLSADGSVVAIGAPFNDGNGVDSGHVRVFQIAKRNPWVQQGLDIDGEAAHDKSGFSTSLSGDGSIVAIGSFMANEATGNVRVYSNESGLWKQVGSNIDGEAPVDQSGGSVSLSHDGTILAIGAQYNDGNGSNSGHVRVYKNISDSWQQIGSDIDGEATGDF
jgi:hypothetical protein